MRIYLDKDEIKALQESGDLLTRRRVIDKIMDETGRDVSEKLLLKYCDYRFNTMAPERFAYSLSFINPITNRRDKCIYWPNSVGLQYTR